MKGKKISWKLVVASFFNWIVWIVVGFIIFGIFGIADPIGPDGNFSVEAKDILFQQGRTIFIGSIVFGLVGFILAFFWRVKRSVITVLITVQCGITSAVILLISIFFIDDVSSLGTYGHIICGILLFCIPLLLLNVMAIREMYKERSFRSS
jgi:hypothetical protein